MRGGVLTRWRLAAAAVLALVGVPSIHAQPSVTPAARIYIEESISTPHALALLNALGEPRPFPVGVHLSLRLPDDATPDYHRELDAFGARGAPLWVAVRGPASADRMSTWQTALRAFLLRHTGRIAILEVRFGTEPSALQRFALQIAATEARARGASTLVAAGAESARDV